MERMIGMWNEETQRAFEEMATTAQEIFHLRGIAVTAGYVSQEIMDWMRAKSRKEGRSNQTFDEADVRFGTSRSGAETCSMKPYGGDRFPIKVKHGGAKAWKLIVQYRTERM